MLVLNFIRKLWYGFYHKKILYGREAWDPH